MAKTVRTVEVIISGRELFDFLVKKLLDYLDEEWQQGKDVAFWAALGHLVGVSDSDAVKKGNQIAKEKGHDAITVTEFRRWLPEVISRFADEVINETS